MISRLEKKERQCLHLKVCYELLAQLGAVARDTSFFSLSRWGVAFPQASLVKRFEGLDALIVTETHFNRSKQELLTRDSFTLASRFIDCLSLQQLLLFHVS